MRLSGTVAVVTSASRGVGRGAIASESPAFVGRVVAALSLDEARMTRTGNGHVVAELAREYGVVNIDGTQPESLREIAERERAERKNKP